MPKKNTPYEYDRILEILDDYWISEPNEYAVSVEMRFVKANGEHQVKRLRWHNLDIDVSEDTKRIASDLFDGDDAVKAWYALNEQARKNNEKKKTWYSFAEIPSIGMKYVVLRPRDQDDGTFDDSVAGFKLIGLGVDNIGLIPGEIKHVRIEDLDEELKDAIVFPSSVLFWKFFDAIHQVEG